MVQEVRDGHEPDAELPGVQELVGERGDPVPRLEVRLLADHQLGLVNDDADRHPLIVDVPGPPRGDQVRNDVADNDLLHLRRHRFQLDDEQLSASGEMTVGIQPVRCIEDAQGVIEQTVQGRFERLGVLPLAEADLPAPHVFQNVYQAGPGPLRIVGDAKLLTEPRRGGGQQAPRDLESQVLDDLRRRRALPLVQADAARGPQRVEAQVPALVDLGVRQGRQARELTLHVEDQDRDLGHVRSEQWNPIQQQAGFAAPWDPADNRRPALSHTTRPVWVTGLHQLADDIIRRVIGIVDGRRLQQVEREHLDPGLKIVEHHLDPIHIPGAQEALLEHPEIPIDFRVATRAEQIRPAENRRDPFPLPPMAVVVFSHYLSLVCLKKIARAIRATTDPIDRSDALLRSLE